jgi:hypothetical protein
MFGQKFTNTNKMLQCTSLYCADFVAAKLAQLNTAQIINGYARHALLSLAGRAGKSEDESTTASSSGSVVLTFLLLPRPFSAEKNVQLCFGASFNADK